ncbi:MAG: DUF2807 domain-containing protein [Patescibacteria group bacterium]|nr:DUF2807 domain-containing protein [Patescibacteria group bacterium]
MTKPVAVVNEVNIYSNKKVVRVVDSRITFSDGSYADVNSGEVVNMDKGYITIGKPPKDTSSNVQKTVEKKFYANVLEVRDLVATISIQPYSGDKILVYAKGAESSLDNLVIREEHGTVVVSKKDNGDGGRITMVSGGGNSIVIGGGRGVSIVNGQVISNGKTIIKIGGNLADTSVNIKVPEGTSMGIFGIEGDVVIGDVKGQLRAKVNGCGNIKAGAVTKVSAKVSGTGSIQISSIKGDASLKVSGSGGITVNSGKIDELDTKVSGTGNINIYATAQNADLDVSGVGSINVSRVVNRPYKSISGIGSINIGNW